MEERVQLEYPGLVGLPISISGRRSSVETRGSGLPLEIRLVPVKEQDKVSGVKEMRETGIGLLRRSEAVLLAAFTELCNCPCTNRAGSTRMKTWPGNPNWRPEAGTPMRPWPEAGTGHTVTAIRAVFAVSRGSSVRQKTTGSGRWGSSQWKVELRFRLPMPPRSRCVRRRGGWPGGRGRPAPGRGSP